MPAIMDCNVRDILGILLCCTLVRLLAGAAFEDGNNNNVKIDKQSLELTQTINIQRQELMQRQCELMDGNKLTVDDLSELQMDHMIVDKEHKLLYCYVPKVGLVHSTCQNNFHNCQRKVFQNFMILFFFCLGFLFLVSSSIRASMCSLCGRLCPICF